MQYATLGHSGIEVSKLRLGGMSFGEASPDFHQWTIGPDETQALGTGMDDETLTNLRDAGCDQEFIDEIDKLPSTYAKFCRLKAYRRELLDTVRAEQRKLECLDYLIYQLRCETDESCRK